LAQHLPLEVSFIRVQKTAVGYSLDYVSHWNLGRRAQGDRRKTIARRRFKCGSRE